MKSKQLTINRVEITAHSDGSITKPFHKRNKRTFGSKHDGGYKHVGIGGKMFHMHRIVAQAFLSDFFDYPSVDHIDGNKTNNDISNLRMATMQFQYRGVTWNKRSKSWHARCNINGKFKHVGSFNDELEAAIARDAYAFSQGFPLEGLNFPENYA